MNKYVDKLYNERVLSKDEFIAIISGFTDDTLSYLAKKAFALRKEIYGTDVYIRGLIEISNYCKNDCYYCGIRKSNNAAERYRLTKKDIIACCDRGYDLGFRTFVMQGGEDEYYTDELMCEIISDIKSEYSDCAVTLSIGEKTYASYKKYKEAGADRFLLRHETSDSCHYRRLHPSYLSIENRKQCLYDLKSLGYQTGTGFMVGSPYQTAANLADDMLFLKEFQPDMVGIGPFIPHKDTPFSDFSQGSLKLTLLMLGLIRLMLPCALIPATTALGTIHQCGREMGLNMGANVIMPNLSPMDARKNYNLYDGKIHTNAEAAEGLDVLKKRVKDVGLNIVTARGDVRI